MSADIAMSRGVAKLFKTRFDGVAELKAQGVRISSVNVLLGIILYRTLRSIFLSGVSSTC